MTDIGYVYASPLDHNADFQRDLLRRHGATRVYEDIATSAAPKRPQLTRLIDDVRADDRVLVWRLDRLGGSSGSVLSLLELLAQRRVWVHSLDDHFDTGGPDSASVLSAVAAFTQLERCLNRERTLVGVYAAKARGRSGGRPRALSEHSVRRVLAMRDQGASVREIAEELDTSRATIYRTIEAWAAEQDDPSDERQDRSYTVTITPGLATSPRSAGGPAPSEG